MLNIISLYYYKEKCPKQRLENTFCLDGEKTSHNSTRIQQKLKKTTYFFLPMLGTLELGLPSGS